jgi:protein-S-isoprenylcysteine O-methyltransferase Ste14
MDGLSAVGIKLLGVTIDPGSLMIRCWEALALIWLLTGFTSKRNARSIPRGAMLVHVLILILAFGLVLTHYFSVGFLRARIVPARGWIEWSGCAMAFAGFAFTIWARYHLGRNWSGTVTVKEGHTLIRSGPYALVRHPIYTGLSLALLGCAMIYGELRCLIGAALAFFEWKRKSLIEERFMIEQFGRNYIDYRREVKALIPLVW